MSLINPTKALTDKRVAIAGGRRFEDIAKLIAKQGGVAVSRPMMRIAPLDDPATLAGVEKLCAEGCDWLILLTGMGTRALVEVAQGLGKKDLLLKRMQEATIATRGYKTVKALKELGFTPAVQDDDGSTAGLRRRLEPFDFSQQTVTLKLHGEPVPELSAWLASRGAAVTELPLYSYQRPSEEDAIRLLNEVFAGELDAVAFTSNTQVDYLFDAAKLQGQAQALQEAFAGGVLAVSVGHVTSEALRAHGVSRIVQPGLERMGAMIVALAQHVKAAP